MIDLTSNLGKVRYSALSFLKKNCNTIVRKHASIKVMSVLNKVDDGEDKLYHLMDNFINDFNVRKL